jgi:hypothetical protein
MCHQHRLSHDERRHGCDHEASKADQIILENEVGGQDDEIEADCEEHRRRQDFPELFDYECEETRLWHSWITSAGNSEKRNPTRGLHAYLADRRKMAFLKKLGLL